MVSRWRRRTAVEMRSAIAGGFVAAVGVSNFERVEGVEANLLAAG
jgi:diketogulonate reductase-like aldo/keto reductase